MSGGPCTSTPVDHVASGALREALGLHMLLEVYGCPFEQLDDLQVVEATVRKAAADAGVTIVDSTFHRFSPQGISGVLVIAESHITVHTWPEKGYAAIDLFTCGHRAVLEKAAENLVERLGATNYSSQLIERGIPS